MRTENQMSINPVQIQGKQITIRPVRKSDKGLTLNFAATLSAESQKNQFLGGVRQLSAKDIEQICDTNFPDSMAFVATLMAEGIEREVGLARYVEDTTTGAHELAISIATEYRHSTLARTLVEYLAAYARKHRVRVLYTVDLDSNTAMRKLADDLNMSVRLDPDHTHQVIYSLNVDAHPETITL
ncbi:MAG: GNAT family N-acetyltransferase [Granulosicoccus sp.]|nr:GNAT family N-acetyltransferase [Granulosicoccus sp.]